MGEIFPAHWEPSLAQRKGHSGSWWECKVWSGEGSPELRRGCAGAAADQWFLEPSPSFQPVATTECLCSSFSSRGRNSITPAGLWWICQGFVRCSRWGILRCSDSRGHRNANQTVSVGGGHWGLPWELSAREILFSANCSGSSLLREALCRAEQGPAPQKEPTQIYLLSPEINTASGVTGCKAERWTGRGEDKWSFKMSSCIHDVCGFPIHAQNLSSSWNPHL